MIRKLKDLFRRALLRGPILDWWIARGTRRWERAYCNELVKSSASNQKAQHPRSLSSAGSLRTILFIADCMYEQRDLIPELGKIARVEVLNLQPRLKAKLVSQSKADVVASAIRDFAASQRRLVPDVIFFYARPALLSDECFDCLRQSWSCPLVGMNLDEKLEFFNYGIFSGGIDDYQTWARRFDLNLTNCLPAVEWYRQRGLTCIYCPQGFHSPDGASPPNSIAFKHQFGFVGSRKPERAMVVDRLRAMGIPIQVWGPGWPNAKWEEDCQVLFRDTQINLGIGFASPSLILTTVKNRDFECPGAGACYLTTYNWELANLYELGKEILCYRSVEELAEMYSHYRNRPRECLGIAQAAWRRCQSEHTWEKRFRKVFLEVGFELQPSRPNH